MNKPRVSFVIPVLNGERYLRRCLRSIRSLEPSDRVCEVLVMDNGSTDRTPEIAREMGFAVDVVPNVHVGVLRNRGVDNSSGELLAFVDADMELGADWLRHVLSAFEDHSVVACGAAPTIPPEASWVQRAWDMHHRSRNTGQKAHEQATWLPSCNVVVRRDAFMGIGGFSEDLETTEDVDLSYRLSHSGRILKCSAMKAVHWGGDPDLRTFCRKEVWRGLGTVRGILSHGVRWDEVPSLAYPIYILFTGLAMAIVLTFDVWQRTLSGSPLAMLALILPAFILALLAGWRARQFKLVPGLFLLYVAYGVARAQALMTGVVREYVPWLRRQGVRSRNGTVP